MGTEGIIDRYVNFYTDFAFKKLFGTEMNKDLLISFLNALLQGREVVLDINYLNTEHLGTQEYDRRCRVRRVLQKRQGRGFLGGDAEGRTAVLQGSQHLLFDLCHQGTGSAWRVEL